MISRAKSTALIPKRTVHFCINFLVIFLFILNSVAQGSSNSASFAPKSLIKRNAKVTLESCTDLAIEKKQTYPYINFILNERLEKVTNGDRQRIFAKQYEKLSNGNGPDGELSTKIVSTHGRTKADKVGQVQGPSLVPSTKTKHVYFPQDITSLDLSLTPEIYNLASKEIEKRKLSDSKDDHEKYLKEFLYVPKLCFRAMILGINFAPVTMTCGLALFSETFREKFWFNMVSSCLARSGPAFIKWGESYNGTMFCKH